MTYLPQGLWSLSDLALSGPSVIEQSHQPWYDLTCSFRHSQQELAEIDIKVRFSKLGVGGVSLLVENMKKYIVQSPVLTLKFTVYCRE